MVRKWIKKIRQKPEYVRDQIAFGLSFGIVAVIATVWAWQVPAQLRTNSQPAAAVGEKSFGDIFSDIAKQIKPVENPKPAVEATAPAVVAEPPLVPGNTPTFDAPTTTSQIETTPIRVVVSTSSDDGTGE